MKFKKLLAAVAIGFALVGTAAAFAADFPVTIEHKFGESTIEAKPKRVVSLSYNGADFVLALGIKPVGVRYWYGEKDNGIWGWADEALGDHKPDVLKGELNIEQIVKMQPDLIVAQWSGLTEDQYKLLSAIAPVVATAKDYGDYAMPWDLMFERIGKATGEVAKAKEITDQLNARIEQIAADHPHWQGKTFAMTWTNYLGAYLPADIRSQLLIKFGFVVPEEIKTLAGEEKFFTTISEEDLAVLDHDILIWIDGQQENIQGVKDLPLRKTLDAHKEGREIYLDSYVSAAFSFSSPLSLNHVLDVLPPLLDAAVDGDPATVVTTTQEAGLLDN